MTAPSVRPSARSVQPDPRRVAHLHIGRRCTTDANCVAACGHRWDGPTFAVRPEHHPDQLYCASCLTSFVFGGGLRCAAAEAAAA